MSQDHDLKLKHFVSTMYTQLCLTLCDTMDCNPSSSSVHGIF